MIHKVTITWDDKELDEAPTWEDFVSEYILDEMHGCIEDMDLSEETIAHAHGIVNKIILHLNTYIADETPTVDAVPVRHGEWLIYGDGCHCSECWYQEEGKTLECMDGQFKYCPNCGAKMDGERKEE